MSDARKHLESVLSQLHDTWADLVSSGVMYAKQCGRLEQLLQILPDDRLDGLLANLIKSGLIEVEGGKVTLSAPHKAPAPSRAADDVFHVTSKGGLG